MNPKNIYPIPRRQNMFYKDLRNISRIVFILASIICVVINIISKTKPWSLIVLWCLFSLWKILFSLKLMEFSFFSYIVKISLSILVLLMLIDYFLISGWAKRVVPIFMFFVLLVMSIYFYVSHDRKERHLISIVILGTIAIAQIPIYTNSLPISNWLAFGFQIATILLFLILVILNWKDLLIELKMRFKTKI